MLRMDRAAFERTVADALTSLPELFQPALENVAVVVREEPDADLLDDAGMTDHGDRDAELLGLYVGTPLTERSVMHVTELPDCVFIFRGPILRICETEDEVRREIRDTVIHEFGHHMGLSDEEMPY